MMIKICSYSVKVSLFVEILNEVGRVDRISLVVGMTYFTELV